MTGIITDIQRFSLTDGPGIRTTVFFKGCNMRCSWCHNPETLQSSPQLMFYPSKCIGCGSCFKTCPNSAHELTADGKHYIDRTLCLNCGKCSENCFAEALKMCGKTVTVEDIMQEVLQDKLYYETSGGGITLSGGEVLLQKDFALELINKCKKHGIHTALETNLNMSFDLAEPLLTAVDLIMCDLKLFDSEAHKKYTGVGNEQIIRNLMLCDSIKTPKIVRTPLIPDVTDSVENIKSISAFLKERKNILSYELLNFNPLGDVKYDALNVENQHKLCRPLSDETLMELVKTASAKLITKVV